MSDKVIKIDPEFDGNTGLAGYVSWQRIEKILHDVGILSGNESIQSHRVGDSCIIIKINPGVKTDIGLAGSVSWDQLEKILRDVGRLRGDETIKGYRVGKAGINFFIKKVYK